MEVWTTTTATGLTRDWSLFLNKININECSSYFLEFINACCCGNPAPHLNVSGCLYHLVQVFEKFTKESTSLLDELSIINESDKGSSVDKDKCVLTHACTHTHAPKVLMSSAVCLCVPCRSADCALLPSFDPETVLQTGKLTT